MINKIQLINETNIVLKKRGRKSKKELELIQTQIYNNSILDECNIHVTIEDSNKDEIINNIEKLFQNINISDVENNEVIDQVIDEVIDEVIAEVIDDSIFLLQNENILPKKRGRKPKGGKIIQQVVLNDNNREIKPNVILHLKCSIKDLYTNSLSENDIQSYNFSNISKLSYDVINENNLFNNNNNNEQIVISNEKSNDNDIKQTKENDIKEIWKKLKVLEHNLHTNNISDKKSACFWCTCDFDNPPVYIPKHNIKETYHVYGCFCSPECATAYLMEEHIDSSSKFERYHLLNHIYTKIYDYTKNIKPAPNPYYMLDKYYGNLSIQEYRSLLRNERLFLVVDKPLTRILPELHEENDDFIINNKIIPSNTYKIKKKLQKNQTKNTILSENFGLHQIM
jgi:hypothetical protein